MEITIATASLYLAFIIFILLKFITHPKSGKNMLPEPWRLPIIGHMHHLIGTMPHRGTLKLAKKYGSLMHLQLGEVSTIVVASPRWAKEVLTKSDIVFANRPETLTGEIIAYHNKDIIFSPYSEYWRQLRKLCTLELLSAKKVKTFRSLREEECWNLVGNIRSLGKSGSPINLSENIFMLIATILSREAFGEGFKEQKASLEMLHEIGKLTGGFDVADIFPTKKFLHHLSGKRAKLTKLHNQVDNVINNIVSERPAYRSSSSQESLLDVLLRLKESDEFPLTLDNVKAVIVVYGTHSLNHFNK
ncbi:Cytochrome P450 71AV8 [Artemisia annua]|uniref:Cytochrome P450 71AV8 n=1 Tax=Artemisia annua TaxID=35608 RepID=A0A2U1KBJ6_ARTAN|nr:Cytochrome P450 71AV8 [Artemisia annua]